MRSMPSPSDGSDIVRKTPRSKPPAPGRARLMNPKPTLSREDTEVRNALIERMGEALDRGDQAEAMRLARQIAGRDRVDKETLQ
jgi:hypothetical protein